VSEAVLLPLTIAAGKLRQDVAVPSTLPIAEILPAIVEKFPNLQLQAETSGFDVTTGGHTLSLTHSFSGQNVGAGAVITLVEKGTRASDLRYDDLTEAVGRSVEITGQAWRAGDSVQLSAYSAVALIVAAAALAVFGGVHAAYTAAGCVVGAILVTLSALAVQRSAVSPGGSIALALTAPLLLGVAGLEAAPFIAKGFGLLVAGIAMIVGSASVFVLRPASRFTAVAPLLLGFVAVAYDMLVTMFGQPSEKVSAALIALLAVLTLVSPWIGLAMIPARIPALSITNTDRIDLKQVSGEVKGGTELAIALRVGAGLATLALIPLASATLPGAVEVLVVALAYMLGTRTLFGRAEALIGLIIGMFAVAECALASISKNSNITVYVLAACVVVAVYVLANNVVSVKFRPQLSRLADTFQVLALVAIIPLATVVWGLM
jgi:hypothetical protein